MKTIIVAAVLCISYFANAQGPFEQGMGKAFQLWGEGKNTEASAMFERIASAEKDSWLPNYYVALVNTTSAFRTKDKETVSALLTKAQDALDIEMMKNSENPELLVMQAMIYTAWLVSDPMTNGMKYSALAMEEYEKAEKLAPDNPRVVYGKAEFAIGGARYWGTDTKPMCAEIDRAIALFATFKPETEFHPKWGLDRALLAQQECNKK